MSLRDSSLGKCLPCPSDAQVWRTCKGLVSTVHISSLNVYAIAAAIACQISVPQQQWPPSLHSYLVLLPEPSNLDQTLHRSPNMGYSLQLPGPLLT